MNKNLKIIIAVFLILIALIAWNIYSPQLFPSSSPYLDSMKNITKQSIRSINIAKGKDKVTLQKKQNKWQVNNKPVDTTKIEELLNALLPTTPPDLVSQSDKSHSEFELNNDLATKIKLDDKQTILLGKITYPNIYARFDKQKEVYLLKNPSNISPDPNTWYDQTTPTPEPKTSPDKK